MLLEHRLISLKQGLFLSLFLIVLTLVFYFFLPEFLHKGVSFPIIFYCLLFFYPPLVIKLLLPALTIYKQVFSIAFLILFVALFFYMIFTLLLYNVINQNLITDFVDSKMTYMLNNEVDDSSKELVYDSLMNNFSIKSQFNSYIFSLIPCVLYSSLISLLLAKSKR